MITDTMGNWPSKYLQAAALAALSASASASLQICHFVFSVKSAMQNHPENIIKKKLKDEIEL